MQVQVLSRRFFFLDKKMDFKDIPQFTRDGNYRVNFLISSNAEKKREFDLEAVKAGASIERYDMNGHVNERIETNKVQQRP